MSVMAHPVIGYIHSVVDHSSRANAQGFSSVVLTTGHVRVLLDSVNLLCWAVSGHVAWLVALEAVSLESFACAPLLASLAVLSSLAFGLSA